MKSGWLLLITLYLSNSVNADVTFGGDGCPAGTARVVTETDGAMTLNLSSYEVYVNQNNNERRSCSVAIPYQVPAGYSASFGQVHLGGFYDLKKGANAVVTAEAFFTGSAGPLYNSNFTNEGAEPISINFSPSPSWSPCGASTILRLNTSILLKTSKPGQGTSQIKIDEIALGKPLLKRCGS